MSLCLGWLSSVEAGGGPSAGSSRLLPAVRGEGSDLGWDGVGGSGMAVLKVPGPRVN